MIRFGEMTEDELFVSYEAALQGVACENTSKQEPLVLLRYFGPDTNPDAPEVGDYNKYNKRDPVGSAPIKRRCSVRRDVAVRDDTGGTLA